jgi:folate-binding protein YgfZ
MANAFHLGLGTVVRFQGKDRCKVFNNLCTQDLRQLAHGQAVETFVTDVKGRTFGHGIAVAWGEEAFLLSVPGQADRLVPHFDRYIIREDAQVSDVSSTFQFWLFRDRTSAARGLGVSVDALPSAKACTSLPISGAEALVLHAPWICEDSVLVLAPSELPSTVLQSSLGEEWVESDMVVREAWEPDRIQAFWPWYGVDLDERNLPQEVDRNASAISFNKGCYLGQETIARLDMLGQIQKKLVLLTIETNELPAALSSIHADDKEVGHVTSVAHQANSGTCLALGYVKRSHFRPGQSLSISGYPATVVR